MRTLQSGALGLTKKDSVTVSRPRCKGATHLSACRPPVPHKPPLPCDHSPSSGPHSAPQPLRRLAADASAARLAGTDRSARRGDPPATVGLTHMSACRTPSPASPVTYGSPVPRPYGRSSSRTATAPAGTSCGGGNPPRGGDAGAERLAPTPTAPPCTRLRLRLRPIDRARSGRALRASSGPSSASSYSTLVTPPIDR